MQLDLLFQQPKQSILSLIFTDFLFLKSPDEDLDLDLDILHSYEKSGPFLAMLFFFFVKHFTQLDTPFLRFLQLLSAFLLLPLNQLEHAGSPTFQKEHCFLINQLSLDKLTPRKSADHDGDNTLCLSESLPHRLSFRVFLPESRFIFSLRAPALQKDQSPLWLCRYHRERQCSQLEKLRLFC